MKKTDISETWGNVLSKFDQTHDLVRDVENIYRSNRRYSKTHIEALFIKVRQLDAVVTQMRKAIHE